MKLASPGPLLTPLSSSPPKTPIGSYSSQDHHHQHHPFFLPPQDPYRVLLLPSSTPQWETNPTPARSRLWQQTGTGHFKENATLACSNRSVLASVGMLTGQSSSALCPRAALQLSSHQQRTQQHAHTWWTASCMLHRIDQL
jgi:hypothetical protein